MLTPEYLAVFSNSLLAIYDQLEVQIVADIARRLVKNEGVTDSALWQYKQAMEIGGLQEEINSQIAEMTGKTEAEIERLFKEAGAMNVRTNVRPLEIAGLSVDLSLSGSMEQTLLAEILRTKNNIYNLTLTTGSTAADLYRQYSNQAYMQAVSGAFSPQQAIRSAVKAAADEGSYVQFPKRRDHLDVAIRRNLLTSVNQTIGVLTEMQAEDLGVQYYEVSAHSGARPSHAEWQGQIYKIEGHDDYPNFEESTGYGDITGLCGVNCRHTFYPYWPGISKPAYSAEKLAEYENHRVEYEGIEYTDYEASQIQRGMERSIRATRRELASTDAARKASEDEAVRKALNDDFTLFAKKLKEQEKRLKSFCRQTNRDYESDRVQVVAYKDEHGRVVHFDRSVSQKAVHAAKKG